MFDRIKKVFSQEGRAVIAPSTAVLQQADVLPMPEWAATQGFTFTSCGSDQKFSIQGNVRGKTWRMELGPSSRSYIQGDELRGRAESGTPESVAVMVMSRPLKEVLEKRTYSKYTDTLRTEADPDLPEELRWLAMFKEAGWDGLPREFWTRYSVLTDQRDTAIAWLEPSLVFQLLEWPVPGPAADVPFIIMLMRGKVYLRMLYEPATVPVLQHAAELFTHACEIAINTLATDPRK